MGNSLTRPSASEVEPPLPISYRRQSGRPRNSSKLTENASDARHSQTFSVRPHLTDGEGRRSRRRKKSRALSTADGNAQQAASPGWPSHEKKRVRESRIERDPDREPEAETGRHRSRKAGDKQRAERTSHTPKRRSHKTQQNSKAIHVEVTEVADADGKNSLKECMICTSALPPHRFPSKAPTQTCTHSVSTCRHCLRKWISSSFRTKLWDQITCPECAQLLSHADVKVSASSSVFKKYDELAARAALEAIPGFRWCIKKGCASGQVHEQGESMPRFKCVSCRAKHCIVHGVKWHEGETCAEYDYRTDGTQKKVEEAASKTWIKQSAKKCPQCKRNIEKASGCDHMTCSKCKHEFCWQCLAPFEPIRKQGNVMHRPTCEYYDDFL